jgi:hypothetical protein
MASKRMNKTSTGMDKAAKDSVASSQVPVIVGDTTCKIDDNTSYNYWGRLFQM